MDTNGQTGEMTASGPKQGTGAWMVTSSWPLGFENLADARITLTRDGWVGGHILTLENARDLAHVVAKVERAAQTAFEDAHNPYFGKALRLTVRDGVSVRALHKWQRASEVPIDWPCGGMVEHHVNTALITGAATEMAAQYIKATVEWLAENPGHPFDVFICGAADMPEWDPDAATGE